MHCTLVPFVSADGSTKPFTKTSKANKLVHQEQQADIACSRKLEFMIYILIRKITNKKTQYFHLTLHEAHTQGKD